jgi:hypothetical protein
LTRIATLSGRASLRRAVRTAAFALPALKSRRAGVYLNRDIDLAGAGLTGHGDLTSPVDARGAAAYPAGP